jgi:hypothetical protein
MGSSPAFIHNFTHNFPKDRELWVDGIFRIRLPGPPPVQICRARRDPATLIDPTRSRRSWHRGNKMHSGPTARVDAPRSRATMRLAPACRWPGLPNFSSREQPPPAASCQESRYVSATRPTLDTCSTCSAAWTGRASTAGRSTEWLQGLSHTHPKFGNCCKGVAARAAPPLPARWAALREPCCACESCAAPSAAPSRLTPLRRPAHTRAGVAAQAGAAALPAADLV